MLFPEIIGLCFGHKSNVGSPRRKRDGSKPRWKRPYFHSEGQPKERKATAAGNSRLRTSKHCMRAKGRFLREQVGCHGCGRSSPPGISSEFSGGKKPSGYLTKGSIAEMQDAKDFELASAESRLKPSRKGLERAMGRSDYLHLCSEDLGFRERLNNPELETSKFGSPSQPSQSCGTGGS